MVYQLIVSSDRYMYNSYFLNWLDKYIKIRNKLLFVIIQSKTIIIIFSGSAMLSCYFHVFNIVVLVISYWLLNAVLKYLNIISLSRQWHNFPVLP